MLASSDACGSADETQLYKPIEASEIPRPAELPPGDHDITAEGVHGQGGASVTEGRANRPVAGAAVRAVVAAAILSADDRQRQVRPDVAAERVRRQLETGRVGEDESRCPGVQVDLVDAAAGNGAAVLERA